MCTFCEEKIMLFHKSKECEIYLTEDNELSVDVDIPTGFGASVEFYLFNINYCPMCGKKLKD